MNQEAFLKTTILLPFLIAFFVNFYQNIMELQAKKIGSSVKHIDSFEFPGFTICPMLYNLGRTTIVYNDSGLTFSELDKVVPSMKSQIVAARVAKSYQYSYFEWAD